MKVFRAVLFLAGLVAATPVSAAQKTIVISDSIRVTIIAIQGNKVRIGIDAPPDVRVDREEVARRIQEFAAPRLVEAR